MHLIESLNIKNFTQASYSFLADLKYYLFPFNFEFYNAKCIQKKIHKFKTNVVDVRKTLAIALTFDI